MTNDGQAAKKDDAAVEPLNPPPPLLTISRAFSDLKSIPTMETFLSKTDSWIYQSSFDHL